MSASRTRHNEVFADLSTKVAPEPRSIASIDADPIAELDADDQSVMSIYSWASQISSMLIRARQRFGGDLDQHLIYLVFMQARFADAKAAALAKARGLSCPAEAGRGLNALSISEITRIPRETTRRKLQALVRSGHLRRTVEGLYRLCSAPETGDGAPDPSPDARGRAAA